MDWQKVDLESVQKSMPSELATAYARWITQYPEKADRLGEIVEHVRTEFRDAMTSHSANVLDPREDYLPVSSVRHCESLVWYTICMEMGYRLSTAANSAATAANLYLRQIAYGHYLFRSEDGSGDLVPSGTVPARKEYGTRTLAALVLLLFGLLAHPARAEWGRDPWYVSITNVTADYTPLHYTITASTLLGHLQGIDAMLGYLSDTNSLYGDLVALPAVVYNLMDVLKSQALYGEYREDAGSWLATSQTNVMFWGTVAASRLFARDGGATIHGDSEILDGGLDVAGDVTVGAGMTLGGVRRDSWPQDPTGSYLPAHRWDGEMESGYPYPYYQVDDVPRSTYGDWYTLFPHPIRVGAADRTLDADYSWFPNLGVSSFKLGPYADAITSWGDVTNPVNSRVDSLELLVESLYAECVGGWAFPDFFTVSGVTTGATYSAAVSTNTTWGQGTATSYNIVEEFGTTTAYRGWDIEPDVVRQSDFSDSVSWANDAEAQQREDSGEIPHLEFSGTTIRIPESEIALWGLDDEDDDALAAFFDRNLIGTLGGFSVTQHIAWDGAKQRGSTALCRFSSPAPGSLLMATWTNVLGAASNGYAFGKTVHLRTWPEGYGSGTYHVRAGWNTNFWAYGLGDFSCISYHTETTPGIAGGVYRPLVLVTPRHAVCANHWKPLVGSNVYWVGRSGAILTNRVTAYKSIRGDLSLARLETPFDTNEVSCATLLQYGWHSFFYGSTNRPAGLPGVAVVGFDCAERGYPVFWHPSALDLGRGSDRGDDDASGSTSARIGGAAAYAGPYAWHPVGGDSGSPTFLLLDGKTILLWCWHTALGGPIPRYSELDHAILDDWGDSEALDVYDLNNSDWYSPDGPPPILGGGGNRGDLLGLDGGDDDRGADLTLER